MSIDYESLKREILNSSSISSCPKPPCPKHTEEQNYIFISYSHKDYKEVYCDLLYLHKAGVRFWYDNGLPAGKDWDEVVKDKIQHPNCAGVIFYLSENLFLSKSTIKELQFTVGDEQNIGKNYFCVNIANKQPTKILRQIYRTYDDEQLELFGIDDRIIDLLGAFTDKATYITRKENFSHANEIVEHVKNIFNVTDFDEKEENSQANSKHLDNIRKLLKDAGVIIEGFDLVKVTTLNGYNYTVPDFVKTIKAGALPDVPVKRITLPNSVTTIEEGAFPDSLHELTLPDSLNYTSNVGFGAGLENISVSNDNKNYKMIDGHLYSKDGKTFLHYNDVPDKTSFSIPEHVVNIGEFAFNNTYDLQTVTIPKTVKTICGKAFFNSSLLEIIVDEENQNYKTVDGALHSKDGKTLIKFFNKKASNIIIPDSITSMEDYAFCGCKSLTSIIIPNGVTSLGNNVFALCKSLTSLTIPESVTSIGNQAFHGCESLKSIIIPNSVTSIGNGAFTCCESLKSIIIPTSVTNIGNHAFHGCESLTSVIIPYSVTSIGDYTFEGCESLTSITIPTSVTSIGNHAFAWCESLTSITIPDSVTSIGDCTFKFCKSLTSITLPTSVTSISDDAFYWCESLTSITMPGITSIGTLVFLGCDSLKEVFLPNNIELYDELFEKSYTKNGLQRWQKIDK